MAREKSQQELEQEQRDAALARQLAEEDRLAMQQQQRPQQQPQQQPYQPLPQQSPSTPLYQQPYPQSYGQQPYAQQPPPPQQPYPPQPYPQQPYAQQQQQRPFGVGAVQPVWQPGQPQSGAGGIQVMCPTCIAVNHIAAHQTNMQHLCGVCGRILPPPPPPVEVVPRGAAASTTICPNCGVGNQLPPGSTGQFMCGSCRHLLPARAQPPPLQPQSQPPRPASDVLHVRCGRCPAVNEVRGQSKTRFQCGSCQAINEVP